MALARYGSLVNMISGTIGSVTFKAGGCGGVLTRRATVSRSRSAAQRARQEGFAAHMREWRTYTATERLTWKQIGQSFMVPNRLAVARHWSAQATFLSYVTLVDPLGETPGIAYPPPVGGVCSPYTLDVIWFGGPYGSYAIWLVPWDSTTVQYLWLTRMMNFGPRNSGGRRSFIGAVPNSSQGTDWDPYIAARGLEMVPGEILRCEFRFTIEGMRWPSPPVVLDITWGVEYQPG